LIPDRYGWANKRTVTNTQPAIAVMTSFFTGTGSGFIQSPSRRLLKIISRTAHTMSGYRRLPSSHQLVESSLYGVDANGICRVERMLEQDNKVGRRFKNII